MRQAGAASEYGVDVGQALLWAVRVGVALATLTPLIVTGGTLFPYVVGKAVYARTVIEITFALWLLLIIYYPQHRLPRSWILIAFALWLLASVVAAFAGVSLTRSFWSTFERMQGLVDLAHWFAFTVTAVSVFRTFAHWRLLFTLSILVCLAVTLVGIWDYYGVADFRVVGAVENRLESTLGNSNYVSAYIILNILISMGLIAQGVGDEMERNRLAQAESVRAGQRQRRQKEGDAAASNSVDWLPTLQVFWLSSIMLNLWALWLSGTRGGLIALVIAAIVFAVPYAIRGRVRVVRLASGVIVGVIAAAVAGILALRIGVGLPWDIEDNQTVERITAIDLSDPSVEGRVIALEAGYRAFLAKPILGWGPENFIVAWGRHTPELPTYEELFDHAHNKVIEEMATKGIVGLLTYLLLWFAMGWALVVLILRKREYEQIGLLIFAMAALAYFVQNLSLFDTPTTLMQFCMLTAFAAAAELGLGERDGHAAKGWLPSGWADRLRLGRAAGALRSSWGVILLPVCVMGIALWVVVFVNVRAYSAAAASAQFLGAIESEWAARAARFGDSVELFPELGGFPRMFLMSEATRLADTLSEEDLRSAAELFEDETQAQLELEPQNWRVQLTLAQFYQAASERDWAYVSIARERLERVRELAPMVAEQSLALQEQLELEQEEFMRQELERLEREERAIEQQAR